jgi:hypothetical protein
MDSVEVALDGWHLAILSGGIKNLARLTVTQVAPPMHTGSITAAKIIVRVPERTASRPSIRGVRNQGRCPNGMLRCCRRVRQPENRANKRKGTNNR